MELIVIQYRFSFNGGKQGSYNLQLDSETLDLQDHSPASFPPWADLHFHQCPHCTLRPEESPRCPLATHLVCMVNRFRHLLSYEEVYLDVIMRERVISHHTTMERALGSLMGLVMAASGCPYTAFFKPMARFHLPLASKEETAYRAASMYMLAQHYRKEEGLPSDLDFEGLIDIYRNVETMNMAVTERLRAAPDSEFAVNALIFLDLYAKTMPYRINQYLAGLRRIFKPYLEPFPT